MDNNQNNPNEPSQPFPGFPVPNSETPAQTNVPEESPVWPHVQSFEPPQAPIENPAPAVPQTPFQANSPGGFGAQPQVQNYGLPQTPIANPAPPTPPNGFEAYAPSRNVNPIPVVKVLSPRGIEYLFLTIALYTAAFSLGSALISMINGEFSFSVLALPAAALLISVPTFAWFFLGLKNAELKNPELKLDASKRRSTQFIQITTFLVSFFTLIGLVATIFYKLAGQYSGSVMKVLFDELVVILISGGILAYYWLDEHRKV